jgi:hypothetical protein
MAEEYPNTSSAASNTRSRSMTAGRGVRVSQLTTNFISGNNNTTDEITESVKSPTGNPLKYDPELMLLMEKLDSVQSYQQFRRWKASFLRRFRQFLDDHGSVPAQASYEDYSQSMEGLEQKLNQVRKTMEDGNLTAERTTVKGRNTLNEMINTITQVTEETESLIPATKAEEKRKQFTKYHLGAVLIEDAFREYDRMLRCNEKRKELLALGLDRVADRQQLDALERYDQQIEKFVDVMHDLGLHEVMLKCRQFFGGTLDEIVLLDPKSGAVIELPRELLLKEGILSSYRDNLGRECFQEEERQWTEKLKLIETLQSKFDV